MGAGLWEVRVALEDKALTLMIPGVRSQCFIPAYSSPSTLRQRYLAESP